MLMMPIKALRLIKLISLLCHAISPVSSFQDSEHVYVDYPFQDFGHI